MVISVCETLLSSSGHPNFGRRGLDRLLNIDHHSIQIYWLSGNDDHRYCSACLKSSPFRWILSVNDLKWVCAPKNSTRYRSVLWSLWSMLIWIHRMDCVNLVICFGVLTKLYLWISLCLINHMQNTKSCLDNCISYHGIPSSTPHATHNAF